MESLTPKRRGELHKPVNTIHRDRRFAPGEVRRGGLLRYDHKHRAQRVHETARFAPLALWVVKYVYPSGATRFRRKLSRLEGMPGLTRPQQSETNQLANPSWLSLPNQK